MPKALRRRRGLPPLDPKSLTIHESVQHTLVVERLYQPGHEREHLHGFPKQSNIVPSIGTVLLRTA